MSAIVKGIYFPSICKGIASKRPLNFCIKNQTVKVDQSICGNITIVYTAAKSKRLFLYINKSL